MSHHQPAYDTKWPCNSLGGETLPSANAPVHEPCVAAAGVCEHWRTRTTSSLHTVYSSVFHCRQRQLNHSLNNLRDKWPSHSAASPWWWSGTGAASALCTWPWLGWGRIGTRWPGWSGPCGCRRRTPASERKKSIREVVLQLEVFLGLTRWRLV